MGLVLTSAVYFLVQHLVCPRFDPAIAILRSFQDAGKLDLAEECLGRDVGRKRVEVDDETGEREKVSSRFINTDDSVL